MPVPILVTKFYPPPVKDQLVLRQGLIERLSRGLNRKATLISAPAGFGKSTLVSAWLDQQTEIEAAWLSLDEDDNDPVRFLIYLTTALQQMETVGDDFGQGILSMLQSPQPPSAQSVLIPIINQLAEFPGHFVLVLDDLHQIHNQEIHQALAFLLDNLPSQLHLVFSTRQDPLLPTGRLRAQDQLTELRAADLRFSNEETADFLNRLMGLDLSPEQVAELEAKTEGWIAGLQLAAISIQNREDISGFIESFSGEHRLILDFLIEEVLARQEERIQNFLLQTSILDRLTPPLCHALTGQSDSKDILEFLERANLFIIPLDQERKWYRYHHLFGELLRQRLGRNNPEFQPKLHQKASSWFLEQGMPGQATEHSLLAGDFSAAARVLKGQINRLWNHGNHGKLRNWLNKFPEDFLLSYPHLGSLHAYYQFSIGQNQTGEKMLALIEKKLTISYSDLTDNPEIEHYKLPKEEKIILSGRIQVMRSLISSFSGDIQGMITHANQALELLPEDEPVWRSNAAFSMGDAYSFQGDMKASYQARAEAVRSCLDTGNDYYTIMAYIKLCSTLREQGELEKTIEIASSQIELAARKGFPYLNSVGLLSSLWGETLTECNQIDLGLEKAREGVRITENGWNIVTLGYSYFYYLRILLSAGKLTQAQELIDKIHQLAKKTTLPTWLSGQTALYQTRLWLANGLDALASDWLNESDLIILDEPGETKPLHYFSLNQYIVAAHVLLNLGKYREAVQLLDTLSVYARDADRISCLIEIKLLQSLCLQAAGETDQVYIPLKIALELSEPRGFFRIYLDQGPALASLLYSYVEQTELSSDYPQRLLADFNVDDNNVPDGLSDSPLVEPLSEREIEVLELMAEGLTYQGIAEQLYISPHTVKTHSRNIYAKLDVGNRTLAVAKARTLGILPAA
jgi:LuxR family maltose regulon positive regulatory protein